MSGHWQGTAFPWLDQYYGAKGQDSGSYVARQVRSELPEEERSSLEADKRRLRELARQRPERQQVEPAEQAFERWRAERRRRARQLFADLYAETDLQEFPTPRQQCDGHRQ